MFFYRDQYSHANSSDSVEQALAGLNIRCLWIQHSLPRYRANYLQRRRKYCFLESVILHLLKDFYHHLKIQIPSPVKAVSAIPSEKPQPPAAKLNIDELQRKTVSLLEEYFSVRLLDEALQCVEELKAPAYYPEFVKEAISLALDKSPPCAEPVANLFWISVH